MSHTEGWGWSKLRMSILKQKQKMHSPIFFHKKVRATGITYMFSRIIFGEGETHRKNIPKLIASLCAGI